MDTDLDIVRYLDIALMSMNQQINDLKALLDQRHATQTKAIDAALAAADKALDKAERVMDRRLDTVNARLTALEKRATNG